MNPVVPSARAARPAWRDVPESTRLSIQARLTAPVVQALGQAGGFTPGAASRLLLADGRRVFVKALPADHPSAAAYRAEARVCAQLPIEAPAPRLLFTVEKEWTALVFEDVDGREPSLRPGSPDLAAVLVAVGGLARGLTPCPLSSVPAVLDDLGPLLQGWSALRVDPPADLDPWARTHLDSLVAMETAWHPWADGDTLLHNDLRPDNMIRRLDGRIMVVDWASPARGAAWLDVAGLVPALLMAGHEPRHAERLVTTRPSVASVPAWAVTGFAAALAGHWEWSRRLPESDGACGLRRFQARAAVAALAWFRHRMRLS
ncbi:hypothetical protein FHR81_001640 [Actinoalloteichus hoggarensis]|uniref:phosphotransferase family protein n=1 Tax=Actinoalloteichus hoggarensis TaxID=1470176 RepID=UPI001790CACB|nr:phosphotransferase [Actinoalloteichus hoggarensis]MBB5920610.1 hypothetical protein [Actinoalloteichus hoggarensis]